MVFMITANSKTDNVIELKWRRREWDDNVYSSVTLQFTSIDSAVTEIHVHQTGIPKSDRYNNIGVAESVEKGWIDMIFRKISMMLGYTFQTEDEFEYNCLLIRYE
jgi:singapore isolate B (sub-type 7) whole genome shotgun sequence assembly, scaffold_12